VFGKQRLPVVKSGYSAATISQSVTRDNQWLSTAIKNISGNFICLKYVSTPRALQYEIGNRSIFILPSCSYITERHQYLTLSDSPPRFHQLALHNAMPSSGVYNVRVWHYYPQVVMSEVYPHGDQYIFQRFSPCSIRVARTLPEPLRGLLASRPEAAPDLPTL